MRSSDELEPLPAVEAEEPSPGTLLLRLRGDFDDAFCMDVSSVLSDALDSLGCSRVLLDLSDVTYLSDDGLRALQSLRRRCRAENRHLVLVGTARPAVHRPLRISGLLPLFDTRPTIQAALHGRRQPAYAVARRGVPD